MKEKDKQVIWLDYFDSNLSKSNGRRVPKSLALSTPRPESIEEGLKRLGLKYEVHQARHPKRHWKLTYYFQVEKKMKKQELLRKLSETVKGVKTFSH
ncbi:MAG: signal recognition particle subunit SRP19/SEC65 family protein [Nitrososphaeria archaeon]|jgi:Signal recognition particle 19 kDa protein